MKPSYTMLALVALPLAGCFVVTNDPDEDRIVVTEPTNPASTLTVRWTISGSTTPVDCQNALAPTVEVRVFDTDGRDVAVREAACSSFATSIPLDAGSYSASALLLGEKRQPRMTEVRIEPFTLAGGDELITDVTFRPDPLL